MKCQKMALTGVGRLSFSGIDASNRNAHDDIFLVEWMALWFDRRRANICRLQAGPAIWRFLLMSCRYLPSADGVLCRNEQFFSLNEWPVGFFEKIILFCFLWNRWTPTCCWCTTTSYRTERRANRPPTPKASWLSTAAPDSGCCTASPVIRPIPALLIRIRWPDSSTDRRFCAWRCLSARPTKLVTTGTTFDLKFAPLRQWRDELIAPEIRAIESNFRGNSAKNFTEPCPYGAEPLISRLAVSGRPEGTRIKVASGSIMQISVSYEKWSPPAPSVPEMVKWISAAAAAPIPSEEFWLFWT